MKSTVSKSMDQQQHHEAASPYPWGWDTHSRPPQSQWLNSTLTEVDRKMKMIMQLIEDDGESFAQRAEMYYQKRPKLMEMLQDLHRSYRALSDKFIKSESSSIRASPHTINNNGERAGGSFSNSSLSTDRDHLHGGIISSKEGNNINSNDPYNKSESGHDSDGSSFDFSKPVDKMMVKNKEVLDRDVDYYTENYDKHVKFSKLLEENLSKQAELIKRNEEKREVISELRKENKILKRLQQFSSTGISGSSTHKPGVGTTSSRSASGKKKGNKTSLIGLFCGN